MKKILTAAFTLSAILLSQNTAIAQIQLPAPSPASTVTQKVGLTDVSVSYSRPIAKGRKIFGEGADFLVPFGNIWRTGANSGTLITFSDDVKVEGNDVPAGEYMVITYPGASEWTIVLYKDAALGGNMANYDAANNQAKFTVKSSKLTEPVEMLTVNIGDINAKGTMASIQIAWENTSVKFNIEAQVEAMVMDAIAKATQVNPANYVAAATYYFDNGKDLNQALKWITMYFEGGKNGNQFWNMHVKAQIEAALGDKKAAKATAKKSLELAMANEGGDFGYTKRNEDLIKSLK